MIKIKSLVEVLPAVTTTKLIVSDLDSTLINTEISHEAGIKAMAELKGDALAKEVDGLFNLLQQYQQKETETWSREVEYNQLIEQTKLVQASFVNEFGIKRWSRETWIIIAAQKLGLKLSNKDVEALRDAYWTAFADTTVFYEDAKIFCETLRSRNIPLVIMTSSDSILKVNEDLSLVYDLKFSWNYKKRRIDLLNLQYSEIVIGDPYDKPSNDFFQLVISKVASLGFATKEGIIFLGDSPVADINFPESLGYQGVLIIR